MFAHATDIVKYMPVDRSSADILSPFLDFTNQKSFFKPNIGQQGGSAYTTTTETYDEIW